MKNFFFLFCLIFIFQCKQKASESKANSYFSEGEIVNYQYDKNGRLSKETHKSYYMVGEKPDSLSTVTSYYYDRQGRKIKVEEYNESGELQNKSLFLYNSKDSLLAEYEFNSSGDTTLLIKNIYDNNGNVRFNKFRRLMHAESEAELLNGKNSYDTLFTITENFYESGLLKRSIDRDRTKRLNSEREFEYNQHKLAKMKYYEFPDSKKQLEMTNYYFSDSDKSYYKRVTINLLGDTIGIEKVEKHLNGKPARTITHDKGSNIFISNYNEIGQIISEILIFKIGETKVLWNFTYDKNGRKVKAVSKEGPLTEKEKNML